MLSRTLILLVLGLAPIGQAKAGSIGVEIGVAAGELSVAAPHAAARPSVGVRVLLAVVDGTGSGRGWTLRVVAARPVAVASVTARCAQRTTCTLPMQLPDARLGVVLRAAPATGMGALRLVVTLAPLPAGAAPVPVSFRVS